MRILVLANRGRGLYKFRKELLQVLIRDGHDVFISLPRDEYTPALEEIGCQFIETRIDAHGTNPVTDCKLIVFYIKMIKRIMPHVVLSYTIKPNVYGGIACSATHTPYIANVTGLGSAIENNGFTHKISLMLYKVGLKKASCVFFQNRTNREYFEKRGLVKNGSRTIPGSGVNIEEHCLEAYPEGEAPIRFVFIGSIIKDKGIEELLEAAVKVKKRYPEVLFDLVGALEEDYGQRLRELEDEGTLIYHGPQYDVHSYILNAHATVLPSYHEGTANVLLESCSTGRPVLASRVPGCMETFDEGITGLGFEAKSVDSLFDAMVAFISLPHEEKMKMGLAGRRKMEEEYRRDSVVCAYMEEIHKIRGIRI